MPRFCKAGKKCQPAWHSTAGIWQGGRDLESQALSFTIPEIRAVSTTEGFMNNADCSVDTGCPTPSPWDCGAAVAPFLLIFLPLQQCCRELGSLQLGTHKGHHRGWMTRRNSERLLPCMAFEDTSLQGLWSLHGAEDQLLLESRGWGTGCSPCCPHPSSPATALPAALMEKFVPHCR